MIRPRRSGPRCRFYAGHDSPIGRKGLGHPLLPGMPRPADRGWAKTGAAQGGHALNRAGTPKWRGRTAIPLVSVVAADTAA